jgi:capsule biosynthesis phosphatase
MIRRERCIVFDIDGTICPLKGEDESYDALEPRAEMIERLKEYRAEGFYIILSTSRNMNTHSGNMGLLIAKTAKLLLAWLDRHEIPYDELHVGKPWPGRGGFYVDDKAIRPDEFLRLPYEEILRLVEPAEPSAP